ncbi:MAG: LytTR family transcriptional regulator DNA-binding domain-containing protein, partial [Clostridia bacterium]|nr:LytTR family transcriptional regulator DNA-binding domain-containing protein [Clostridia bacterium]
MESVRVVICGPDSGDLQLYASLCREIGENITISTFQSSRELLFEMSEPIFASLVNIIIICADNSNAPASLRAVGYDGLLLIVAQNTGAETIYKAFDARAHNIILKGDRARFTAVFKQALDTAAQQTKDYIALSAGGEYRQIDLRDILYFETMPDHTVNVEYKGGNFRFRSSLSALEQRLEGRGFLRAHRAYIIS